MQDLLDSVQTETKTKILETKTKTKDILTIKTIEAIITTTTKTTDTIKAIFAKHQTSNKPELTQINSHIDLAIEQSTNPGIAKLLLTVEDWDIYLPNVEHHERIRQRVAIQILTITIMTCKITIKTATKFPHSNKRLYDTPVYVPGWTRWWH